MMSAFLEFINYINNNNVESLVVGILQLQDTNLSDMNDTTNFVMWSTRLFFNIIFPIIGGVILMKSNSIKANLFFYSLNIFFNIFLFIAGDNPILIAIIKSFSCCLSTTICISNTITVLKYMQINRISLAFSIMYLGQLLVDFVENFQFFKEIFDANALNNNKWKLVLFDVVINFLGIFVIVMMKRLFFNKCG